MACEWVLLGEVAEHVTTLWKKKPEAGCEQRDCMFRMRYIIQQQQMIDK